MPSVTLEAEGHDPIVVHFTTEEWQGLIREATKAECTVEALVLARIKQACGVQE